MKRRWLLGHLVVVALACCGTRAARAQEQPEALIRQGVELRRQGHDALAQGYFKRAYVLAHTPRSAAQLGLVEQALSNFVDAEQHLDEALDNADAWVEQNRATLEQSRAFVRARLARVETRGLPRDATVAVGHRTPVPVAVGGVVWAPPGSVTLTYAAPDRRPVSRDVAGAAGATVVVAVELPPVVVAAPGHAPSPPAAVASVVPTSIVPPPAQEAPAPLPVLAATASRSEPETGHARRVAGVVIGSAGLALAVGGIVTYLIGSSKLTAIMNDAAAGNHYNTGNDDYQTLGDVGIGLMVAGGVAAAAGATLYLLNGEPGAERGRPAISVGYLPGAGGQLQIRGRF